MPETKSFRISDTLSWHPRNLHMPGSLPSEAISSALTDLIAALHLATPPAGTAPNQVPYATILPNLSQQLQYLQQLYGPPVNSVVEQMVEPVAVPQGHNRQGHPRARQVPWRTKSGYAAGEEPVRLAPEGVT